MIRSPQRLAILKYKSIFGRTLNIKKKTVSHTESEPGYGQVVDAAPRWFAGLLGFGPTKPLQTISGGSQAFKINFTIEETMRTQNRHPRAPAAPVAKTRFPPPTPGATSRDFKPPNITLTQQFHCDLQSLPRKSHCNDNVLW